MGQVVDTLIMGVKMGRVTRIGAVCSVYTRCILSRRLNKGIWIPSRESTGVFRCWPVLLSRIPFRTVRGFV